MPSPTVEGQTPDAKQALWRAIAVFRFASVAYAAALVLASSADYARPAVAWAVLAGMAAWTVFTSYRYTRPAGRTYPLLTADVVVTGAALLSTIAAQHPQAMHTGASPVTATWVAGPVLAWAIKRGRRAGIGAAIVLSGCDFLVRGERVVVTNGTVLMLLAGITVGYLSGLAGELESERRRVIEVQAASRERERLARDIHDSVLQVLAMVQRRGAEAGGEAAELGRLAGQQESALRTLIASGGAIPPRPVSSGGTIPPRPPLLTGGLPGPPYPPGPPAGADSDLRGLIQAAAAGGEAEGVTVSAPAAPVRLDSRAAQELASAVRAALDNVRQHCGEHARAWVLIEDEPDAVTVTIRDDGPGMSPTRLAEAAAAGRLGVSHSIRGRMRDIGGEAGFRSAPGDGTEVELRVPRH
jgi:signal transduction histidine kinase